MTHKINLIFKIILIFTLFFYQISFSEEKYDKNDMLIKKDLSSNPKLLSLWVGGGIGFYIISHDMHEYLNDRIHDTPNRLYLSLSGKVCFDYYPLSWLNIESYAEAYSSINYSGNLLRKHPMHNISAGLLPGWVFKTEDALYNISIGPSINKLFYENYSASGIGYRIKFSFIPFVNDMLDFPTVKGVIIFDYLFAKDRGFELGAWGFQIGSEFYLY